MRDYENELLESVGAALKPPSPLPQWQWWEENIRLDNTSNMQGRYSTKLVPMVRNWANWAQNPYTRRLVVMVAAQSTKTQNLINMLLWEIKEDPAPTMWVMASKESAEEFAKKRLFPAIYGCEAIQDMVPSDRKSKTKSLMQFASMNLILRGSNARLGLQSDPIRRIKCDERREWKKGAIDLLRKRLRTFHNSIEISTGTAGTEHDELHLDFIAGSQGFIHWNCPACQHSQPFRFGKKASVYWPEARTKGGLVWDDAAKVNGEWDEAKVKASVEYECESCAARFKNHQKLFLLQSMHEFHRFPERLPKLPSLHWSALYMPWPDCDWAEIVWEFLKALKALEHGNIEPLKAFVTETLGEPWRDESESAKPSDLLDRRADYKSGEKWPDARDIFQILTIDVQHGFLVLVHRQWKLKKGSRMVRAFRRLNLDEARAYQVEQKIKDKGVFIDCAYLPREVYEACLAYGWNAITGDEREEFTKSVIDPKTKERVSIKTYWAESQVDPHIGTSKAGSQRLRRFSWSKPHYNEKLFVYCVKGKAEDWELPNDIDREYCEQMQVPKRVVKGDGSVEWDDSGGRHDYPDCERMQQAAADICSLTKSFTVGEV